jgi:hypothetical protein
MAKPKPQKFMIGTVLYVLLFAGAGQESIGGSDKDNKCGGEERWEEKILIDPGVDQINTRPIDTTIAGLTGINTKTPDTKFKNDRPRMEIEKKVYRIKNCFITDVLRENDNDLHLVIEDGDKKDPHTMIAEIPDPKCKEAQGSEFIENFIQTRQVLLDHASNYRHYLFTITGVLFVDKAHGQTGVAPNAVEIHPILELRATKKINPILK